MDTLWRSERWHPDWMHGDGMMDRGGDGDLLGVAVLAAAVLALAVIAVLSALVVRGRTARPSSAGTAETAQRPQPVDPDARLILDGRLARGEISPEEYQTTRALLEGVAVPTASREGSR